MNKSVAVYLRFKAASSAAAFVAAGYMAVMFFICVSLFGWSPEGIDRVVFLTAVFSSLPLCVGLIFYFYRRFGHAERREKEI
jgi:hypothetical protein